MDMELYGTLRILRFVGHEEDSASATDGYRTLRPQDTSASRHSGTLRHRSQDTSTPKTCMVRDTSTRVPWSRKSRDTSTQDNSDETPLHRWFVLSFGTDFVVPKCLVAEVSGSPTVLTAEAEETDSVWLYFRLAVTRHVHSFGSGWHFFASKFRLITHL